MNTHTLEIVYEFAYNMNSHMITVTFTQHEKGNIIKELEEDVFILKQKKDGDKWNNFCTITITIANDLFRHMNKK